jgi:two-component system NarL family sensor kinase
VVPEPTAGLSVAVDVPELRRILVEHAYRGIRVQFLLRAALVIFMVVAIAAVPPARDRTVCFVIVASYVVWAVGLGLWTRSGGENPVRWMWVALLVDALALTALTLVAGVASSETWTADLLVNGFFLLPTMAATQLRPWVAATVAGPAVAAYFAVSVATKTANTEPWASILVRTFALVGLGLGCVALSRVQLSRVLTIAGLARDRADLLDELVRLEARERSALAEQLHDGALQYVLAARQDLEDARSDGDPVAFDRVEYALSESSTLLRATVTQLHPAVLDQAGLARALRDLVAGTADRARLVAEVDVTDWPDATTPVDGLLYSTARELLTNVVKHAEASTVRVRLVRTGQLARLSIADDGRGIEPGAAATRLAEGHIGLASLRTRIAAAGGLLEVASSDGGGTIAVVELPIS